MNSKVNGIRSKFYNKHNLGPTHPLHVYIYNGGTYSTFHHEHDMYMYMHASVYESTYLMEGRCLITTSRDWMASNGIPR